MSSIETVDRIIDYENGELNAEDTLALFSDLVRTGMAWSLQGHYGRAAAALIESGILDRNGTIDEDRLADFR
jgi:hypothetical protein